MTAAKKMQILKSKNQNCGAAVGGWFLNGFLLSQE